MLCKDAAVESALMHVLYGSGATAGDKGGLVAGLEHFCQSCLAWTSWTVIQFLCTNFSSILQ